MSEWRKREGEEDEVTKEGWSRKNEDRKNR